MLQSIWKTKSGIGLEKVPVFVYGTLKSGGRYNYILKTSDFKGSFKTVDSYLMYNLGKFPAVAVYRGDGVNTPYPVKGEVYEVSYDVLNVLDTLEGNGNIYARQQVLIEGYGYAWMYIIIGTAYIHGATQVALDNINELNWRIS